MNSDRDQLRQQIDNHLQAAEWSAARNGLESLWRAHGSPALAAYVSAGFERLRGHCGFHPCRVAILRSFTVEPVAPLLRATAWTQRLDLTVKIGEFNAYAQEILDPAGWLYEFAPDVAVLAIQTQDIAPELWDGYADCPEDRIEATVAGVVEQFRTWFQAFRSQSSAYLLVHSLEVPAATSHGILDHQCHDGQAEAVRRINAGLRRLAAESTGVHVLDYDALVASYGKSRWRDDQRWATVKLPMRADGMQWLANEWARYLCPIAGRSCKVLVADLDNTLWGGVIGEEGVSGIKIDREYPGIAYWKVQRALLDLKRRGVLLAICSKNNHEDAMEAFRVHPGMLLNVDDFAASRINWCDKASNLREIAVELNVGLDSLAFLDDNPLERERVRQELPEVTVLELPSDAMGFADAVRNCAAFERLAVSTEDAQRSRYYAEQRVRSEALGAAGNVEDFYRSLQQEVEIAPVTAATLARTAQLTQKTNQFNCTTRRYTEQQIAERSENQEWDVLTVRVKDRFGDNGLVGVMLTRTAGGVCEIDTFLLSCRVISRTVETAMLSYLASESRARGASTIRGWFVPTAKNAPASDVFRKHGFEPGIATDAGTSWHLDLSRADIACPAWIQLTATKGSLQRDYALS